MNESREGFCRRGRGRSFHVDGPKTENRGKARESGNSGESGAARNLQAESQYERQSGEHGRVCKVEDSYRDKTDGAVHVIKI